VAKKKASNEKKEADVTDQVEEKGEHVDENPNMPTDDELSSLKQALEQAEAKAQESWDKMLRIQAESENMRRRMEKDVENARKFGVERLVNELLPIMDSMELGLAAANDQAGDVTKFVEGSQLTLRMMSGALDKFGVKAIDPQGEKFNPELHQAMSMQEKDGVEANTVIAVVQKGYSLNERVVRPAMVIIAKEAAPPPNTPKIDETA